MSTNGINVVKIQLGDSGGIENSNYLGSSDIGGVVTNLSDGFVVEGGANAAAVRHGTMILTLIDSATFTWGCQSIVGRSDTNVITITGGTKALSAELTQLRLTAGGDTFDAGSINISYSW